MSEARVRPLLSATLLACAALEIWALADRSGGEPRNRDIRRYVLGEIFDAHRVEQRFSARADGLSAITVYPRPASPAPSGTVVFELRDRTGGGDGRLVHRETTALEPLTRQDAHTIRFARQDSAFREYALVIGVEGGSDGQGFGLLASRGPGHRAATLWIDGREQYGDLVFETTVEGATSAFGAIAAQLEAAGLPLPAACLVLLLAGKYAGLYFVLRAFTRRADAVAPARARHTAPAPPA
jgi:hypothetical protein